MLKQIFRLEQRYGYEIQYLVVIGGVGKLGK